MTDHAETLWTADELVKATGGTWLRPPPADWVVRRVSYDVEGQLEPQQLIVARAPSSWRADAPDSCEAIAKLCRGNTISGVIIQEDQRIFVKSFPAQVPLLVVANTRIALDKLASAARKRFAGKVIALSGTVGKTTSRQMLVHALSGQGPTYATRGNNNNFAGVCRTMSYVPRDAKYAVIELGFGFPLGWIGRASLLIRPHAVLLTQLGLAHLDTFGNVSLSENEYLDRIASQKLGMLDGAEKSPHAVLPRDSSRYDTMLNITKRHRAKPCSFGRHENADTRLLELRSEALRSFVRASFSGRIVEYELGLPGEHMALNSLGVLTVAQAVGADLQEAAASLSTFSPVGGRAKISELSFGEGTITFIDDSFNATPLSVQSTLNILGNFPIEPGSRRIALLGDILHLGPQSPSIHAALAESVVASKVDHLITTGDLARHIHAAAPQEIQGGHYDRLADAYQALRAALRPGDVLTIKASTPINLQRIAAALAAGRQAL